MDQEKTCESGFGTLIRSMHFVLCSPKEERESGKLPTTVPDFIRQGVPEVYRRTAGKEPFLG
jgi:hypothetical protein